MTRRTARISATGSKLWASLKSLRRHAPRGRTAMSRRDRLDSPRMFGSHRDLQPTPSAPRPIFVRRLLLLTHPHASLARQGLPPIPPDSASQRRNSRRHLKNRWLASSLRASRRLSCSGFLLTNGCAACSMPSCEDLYTGGYFDLDQAWVRSWLERRSVSLKRINSTPILAPARIPVQMEFS